MNRSKLGGHIRRPNSDQIRELALSEYMDLSEEEVIDIGALINLSLNQIERLDDMFFDSHKLKYHDRNPGERPTPEEDPYNIFIRKCSVKGAISGILAGKRVGLKDSVRLANVPMTNASRLMHSYVPTQDATVVERLLDAGAEIVGKLNMDNFSMGGTSETGDYGAVFNPCNPEFSAGGSSGGSGAAVAAGLVDIAIGVDEGGSARIPASWCGAVAMKATHGVVPSFGITYLDHTIDFVCPIAATVKDTALALEAIAGEDFRDPQWIQGCISTEKYADGLDLPIDGLRIGVVGEAMSWPESESDVISAVNAAVGTLAANGAQVEEVSIPWWSDCGSVLLGLLCHTHSAMVESDLEGYWRGGICDPGWQEAFGKARRAGSDGFPPLLKVQMIMGKYLRREYCSVYFSKAQNARVAMTQDIDRILQHYDVLVTPTVPTKAVKLTRELQPGSWEGRGAIDCNKNTSAFNLSGHPALTVPCGIGEYELPIGIQLAGRRYEEALLFRVGAKIESVAQMK